MKQSKKKLNTANPDLIDFVQGYLNTHKISKFLKLSIVEGKGMCTDDKVIILGVNPTYITKGGEIDNWLMTLTVKGHWWMDLNNPTVYGPSGDLNPGDPKFFNNLISIIKSRLTAKSVNIKKCR